MLHNVKYLLGCCLLLCAFFCTLCARADHALVIGVNKYPYLDGANLDGCVNDANLMGDKMKSLGFTVHVLLDGKATKAQILAKINEIKTLLKPNERFVFFFAGHGAIGADGLCRLLVSDTQVDGVTLKNGMSGDEVYDLVKALPARSRTVVLDSCYSEGMSHSRALGKHPGRKNRYYALPNAPRTVPANQATRFFSKGRNLDGSVAYLCAARTNEQAYEEKIDRKEHGIFTYALCKYLTPTPMLWSSLHARVSRDVVETSEDCQHPSLAEGYENTIALENTTMPQPAPNPPAPDQTWDAYNSDHIDPSKVTLLMTPDQTTFKVNEQLSFVATAKIGGYLVLLERGTSGRVNLLYPRTATVDSAMVKAGDAISIPDEAGMVYTPDAPGTERVKAILFTSRAAAEALLKKFEQTASQPAKDLRLVMKDTPVTSAMFFTADFTFEVTP